MFLKCQRTLSLITRRWYGILTKDRFPNVKRGNYAALRDEHVLFFENLLGKNRIITNSEELQAYNTDWLKMVHGCGKIVLKPKTTEEVSSIIKYCNECNLAVCPQGGNTGLVGGSVPVFDEIILSTASMNDVLDFDELNGVLVCQSGCVLENLSNFVSDRGFIIPLDLGAKGSCHIGGNVSTNAGGLRLLRYGSLHNSILGLQVVLANGDVLDCMNTLKKNNTGYHLKHLFIGSEGTLGFVTKVAIHCPPLPKSTNLALLGLCDFDAVLSAYRLARSHLSEILSSCEMMDAASVNVVKRNLGISCPVEAPFFILLETSGSNASHDEDKLNAFLNAAFDKNIASDGFATSEPSKMAALWRIRESITAALAKDGFSYKYDVSIPLTVFYEPVSIFRDRLKHLDLKTICGYGHLGDGNLHLNLTSSEYRDDIWKEIEPFVYELVAKYRGSISAEHGIGLKKVDYLGYSKTKAEIALMKNLKHSLDPKDILNPYKKLWEMRERMAEALIKDGFLYTFDISINLNNFYEGVTVLEKLMGNEKRIKTISGFGHLGDGNIHVNATSAEFDASLLEYMESAIYKWTCAQRGSVSSEHGIGFEKQKFLKYSKTPNVIEAMKNLKRLLDPKRILNPYKILP